MYDAILTIGQEVKCIWKGKPSLVTGIYLIQRYLNVLAYTLEVMSFANIGVSFALPCWNNEELLIRIVAVRL